jgi:uncharacterized damage-inducible protein DinB
MTIGKSFLGELDQEAATTRRLLERVPMDKQSWKPHKKSTAMGPLANHIVQLFGFMQLVLTSPEFSFTPGDPNAVPPEIKSNKELLDRFDANVKAMRDGLAAADDATMQQAWTLRSGDTVIFSLPRAAVVRIMILNHVIHHRGQLSVYLRLNDVPVPSMYGPSADEPL